jgi:Cyclic nucleotide-binding domain
MSQVSLQPEEVLFCSGDCSESGLYAVVEGNLDVFCQDGDQRVLTNTLNPGESVGDLDVVDGTMHRWRDDCHVNDLKVSTADPVGALCFEKIHSYCLTFFFLFFFPSFF